MDAPTIRFNYNQATQDIEVMKRGIAIAQEIVSQGAFAAFRGEQVRPASTQSVEDYIRAHSESAYHPSGTCRMGRPGEGVVDDTGCVQGVSGLRVVDASIMPEITNGNLNAPVIMMAEKIVAGMLGEVVPSATQVADVVS